MAIDGSLELLSTQPIENRNRVVLPQEKINTLHATFKRDYINVESYLRECLMERQQGGGNAGWNRDESGFGADRFKTDWMTTQPLPLSKEAAIESVCQQIEPEMRRAIEDSFAKLRDSRVILSRILPGGRQRLITEIRTLLPNSSLEQLLASMFYRDGRPIDPNNQTEVDDFFASIFIMGNENLGIHDDTRSYNFFRAIEAALPFLQELDKRSLQIIFDYNTAGHRWTAEAFKYGGKGGEDNYRHELIEFAKNEIVGTNLQRVVFPGVKRGELNKQLRYMAGRGNPITLEQYLWTRRIDIVRGNLRALQSVDNR